MTNEIKTIEDAKALGLTVTSLGGGYWIYEDKIGYQHFFKGSIELTRNIKTKHLQVYSSGDWEYRDTMGDWHRLTPKEAFKFANIADPEASTRLQHD